MKGPRRIPVHILMSLANKYSCNLVAEQCTLSKSPEVGCIEAINPVTVMMLIENDQ